MRLMAKGRRGSWELIRARAWQPFPSYAGGRPRRNAGVRRRGSVHFEIIGQIEEIETVAAGLSVRERTRLSAQFGRGRWRKLKGKATVRLAWGEICRAEVHWYEAHGIGRRKFKIKRFLE